MPLPLLLCPGCRTLADDRLDVRTLERAGDVLWCECGRRYPIVDGVPIVMVDPTAYLVHEIASIVERDLPAEVAALLVETGPDDAPYARLLEHLSIYLDAHWGDRANPPPDGPGPAFAAHALVERVAARSGQRVEFAIELGCGVGRVVAELAAGADHVVGLDLHFGALRRARRLLAGDPLTYNRRVVGRHYQSATVSAGDRSVDGERVTWLCGDALDPPLLPQQFDRVVALNLLDSVKRPPQLLSVLDGLCAPGGEILLSSPYAWQTGVVDEDARLGGANPAHDIAELLQTGRNLSARYEIEEQAELSWTLRKDARTAVSYRVHYLRARKKELPQS
jgi:SAM-dependent methyltransferase